MPVNCLLLVQSTFHICLKHEAANMASRAAAIVALALCLSSAFAQTGDQTVPAGNCVPGCKNRGVCTAVSLRG
jgi:hypothetical protein